MTPAEMRAEAKRLLDTMDRRTYSWDADLRVMLQAVVDHDPAKEILAALALAKHDGRKEALADLAPLASEYLEHRADGRNDLAIPAADELTAVVLGKLP